MIPVRAPANPNRTCASCSRFPLYQAVENGGVGQCSGYDRPAVWNDKFCVLHLRADDTNTRRPLVAKLMNQQGEQKDG